MQWTPITSQQLRNFAAVVSNIDKDELEAAGVTKHGQVGGSDWKRFNDDPMMFVLKLTDDACEKLCGLINEKM